MVARTRPNITLYYAVGLVRTSLVAILPKFSVNIHGKSVHLSLILSDASVV